ncbi:MAG: flagellar basal-body rod protein FlgF [Deltaproteobacteria bacterium]
MDRAIFVALSGAMLQEKKLEVLSDSLANANTAGFKRLNPIFKDVMASKNSLRSYAQVHSLATDLSSGAMDKTERPLDVAIKGEGFFVVNTGGGLRYTRDGNFTLSTDGTLTTREGYEVQGENGPVRLSSTAVAIDEDGVITENNQQVERLKLAYFEKPETLGRAGSLFVAPDNVQALAAQKAKIEQGYIETSNVSVVKAMTSMIEALRSYETQTKLIQTVDDMTRKSVEEVGRV